MVKRLILVCITWSKMSADKKVRMTAACAEYVLPAKVEKKNIKPESWSIKIQRLGSLQFTWIFIVGKYSNSLMVIDILFSHFLCSRYKTNFLTENIFIMSSFCGVHTRLRVFLKIFMNTWHETRVSLCNLLRQVVFAVNTVTCFWVFSSANVFA